MSLFSSVMDGGSECMKIIMLTGHVIARWYFGLARTWRMSTPITWPCEWDEATRRVRGLGGRA